jgi:hypothetical protein
MSIQKMFRAALLAGVTLTGTNVWATAPKSEKLSHRVSGDTNACMNYETKIATASEWVIGCKDKNGEVYYFSDDKKKKEETVVTSTETELEPQVISPKPTEKKKEKTEDTITFNGGIFQASWSNYSLSVQGVNDGTRTGIKTGLIIANDEIGFWLTGSWNKYYADILGVGTMKLTKKTNATITGSMGSKDYGEFSGDKRYSWIRVKASGFSMRFDHENLYAQFAKYHWHDTLLGTDISTTQQISTVSYPTFTENTIKDITRTDKMLWKGAESNNFALGFRQTFWNVELTADGGIKNHSLEGKNKSAHISAAYYAWTWLYTAWSRYTANVGRDDYINITKQLTDNLATALRVNRHTSFITRESVTQVLAGIIITDGSGWRNKFNMPSTRTAYAPKTQISTEFNNPDNTPDAMRYGMKTVDSKSTVVESKTTTAKAAVAISSDSIKLSRASDTGDIIVNLNVRPGFDYYYQLKNDGNWIKINNPISTLQSPPLNSALKSSTPIVVGSSTNEITFTIPNPWADVQEISFRESNPSGSAGNAGPITTVKIPLLIDAPTEIILEATNITSIDFLAKCNIKDLDGASGMCYLREKTTNTLIDSWSIGANKSITRLKPNTEYTLVVTGSSKNNRTKQTSDIQELREFKTLETPNTAPTANPDFATVISWQSVQINPLANDKDDDRNTLKIGTFTQWKNGKVTKNDDGSLTYTPKPGFVGPDEFTYTANDGKVDSTATKVTIEVQPVPNTAPTAIWFSLGNNPLVRWSLTAGQTIGTLSCTDLESGNNCFYTTSDPRFSIIGNQVLVAQAGINLSVWPHRISITARDSDGASMTDDISIDITVPDTVAPVITLTGLSIVNIVQGGIYTEPGATCVDNKDVTCNVTKSGTVDTNTPGTYTLTYTAIDSSGNTSTKTRTVKVNPIVVVDPTPNLDWPTISTPSVSGWSLIVDNINPGPSKYRARTDRWSMTIGNLMANDPEGIGNWTIISSLFGNLASGNGPLPNSVSSGNPSGKFGQVDIITITVPDMGSPSKTSSTSVTITYGR